LTEREAARLTAPSTTTEQLANVDDGVVFELQQRRELLGSAAKTSSDHNPSL
jgi:hypothetical protein